MKLNIVLFLQLTEKNQKTSSNQSTKFHQLQQMFGNGTNNNVVNSIISNELNRESPNNSPARIITNSDIFHSENEVSKILCFMINNWLM